jgi:hypothetical protein
VTATVTAIVTATVTATVKDIKNKKVKVNPIVGEKDNQ